MPANSRDAKRQRFDLWVGKIPWKRTWQPIPVFLPGESPGQRTLEGYIQSTGSNKVGYDWNNIAHMHTYLGKRLYWPHPNCSPVKNDTALFTSYLFWSQIIKKPIKIYLLLSFLDLYKIEIYLSLTLFLFLVLCTDNRRFSSPGHLRFFHITTHIFW